MLVILLWTKVPYKRKIRYLLQWLIILPGIAINEQVNEGLLVFEPIRSAYGFEGEEDAVQLAQLSSKVKPNSRQDDQIVEDSFRLNGRYSRTWPTIHLETVRIVYVYYDKDLFKLSLSSDVKLFAPNVSLRNVLRLIIESLVIMSSIDLPDFKLSWPIGAKQNVLRWSDGLQIVMAMVQNKIP